MGSFLSSWILARFYKEEVDILVSVTSVFCLFEAGSLHYVALAAPELTLWTRLAQTQRSTCLSASQVLGVKAQATMYHLMFSVISEDTLFILGSLLVSFLLLTHT